MSSKWPVVLIDDIKADLKNAITIGPFGSRMKSDCYVESGIPVIRGTNLGPTPNFINEFVYITIDKADELASCNVYKNDLVFPHRGSIGEVGIVEHDKRYVLSSSLMKLTCDPHKACPKYIYYFFKSNQGRHELLKNSSQVGTPGIGQPLSSLKAIELPLPTLNEQSKIAKILGELDEKIELNQVINQTLEQMAQALFKSWFVDFEPVKAKMAALEAGGSQEDATLAAMTAISGKDADALTVFEHEHPEQYAEIKATAELFPSAMQESELGGGPEGWKFQPFGELLSHTIGGDWGKDESDDKHKMPVRIIRGTDIPNIKSCQDSNVPFRYVEEKKLKTRSLNAGDIVIEVSGGSPTQPTGRSIYVTDEILKRLSLPVEPASFCRLFRPKSKELGMVLGLHLEKIYQDGKTWLYQNQSTGISNFQTKVFLENEMVAVAQSEILKLFYKATLPFVKLMHSSENIKLTQLRDTLLPKLLSGEITLPEAEQAVSEAENV
ncbi:restriction endonuclease subunit S [Leclercia sp. AS011]|uniref:restriction endonuclease subunit S n=1 Tax=Leclercia sp. AS011 TaxID=3081257 RepID=UPI003016DFE0